ncbi:thiamine pyrophosphate-dependent enzyme [Patescibacteria group bacterium AH-259-L05]|nr:thiamine pyrophosphate-dependent enzyme [Patescibacteria group bacterium AH-259-L05]
MSHFHGFTKEELLTIYRNMVLTRKLDEKMLILLRQGKGFFHIGAGGHEAAQLAAARVMRPGEDWFYPYYRDLPFCLGIGMTAREVLLCFLSRDEDPNSGGRQMPTHYSHKKLRVVSQSSPTGTQFLQAVGCGMAVAKEGKKEVVYVSAGEGTTSQGDFHEALNWSSKDKLPIIFHIEDNKYAISVHISEQTSGASVYHMVAGYKNLARFQVDGTDFFESYLTFQKAVDRARKGKGPSVIVSDVVRLFPHSSSDDHRKYRKEEEIEADQKRDPIKCFSDYCVEGDVISHEEFQDIDKEVEEQVRADADWAESRPLPDPESATRFVYSQDSCPLLSAEPEPNYISDKIVMVDAINHALREEMSRNDKMVVYGQDVADMKGGVFTATKGLTIEFGHDRVFNSPLAESSIIGTAAGMAVAEWKPVVEIQFGDYIWTAMMQIRNEVAPMRYRSRNDWSCPIVIRVPVGGYIHGGLCHSQSIDGYFLHLPGIRIAYPSNAEDAKGLLKTACRIDDPVMFMEHKALYRLAQAATPEPDENYLLPFGKAKIIQEGSDLSIITYGMMVYKSLEASKKLHESTGASIEIIDLRTLNPMDLDTIERSLKKTNKVLVVYEDNITNGPGAEISAIIGERFFEFLDGPVIRVAAKDSPVPFSSVLEDRVLPQTEDIVTSARQLLEY